MFERFTEQARQVVVLAQEEARTLKHDYIGTEHILLGLLREQEGVAAGVLESLEITVERVRGQVLRIVGTGDAVISQIPFTPRAKKVLELALREALNLGHNYIGTEHILLGLVRENEGLASRILLDFDAGPDKLRREVIRALSRPGGSRESQGGAVPGVEFRIQVGLAPKLRRLLMAAAGRALDDGRTETQLRDLLLALTHDQEAARQLVELGVEEPAVREAHERADPPGEPRERSDPPGEPPSGTNG